LPDALPDVIAAAAPSVIGTTPITAQQPTQSSEPVSATSSANLHTSASAEATEQSSSMSTAKNASHSGTEQTAEERTRLAQEEVKQGSKRNGPLEAVLHMQPPENADKQGPALTPPQYIHHFDTYSLVKQLSDAGYTHEQATTSMKAIRTSLAQNLDVAQSTLVSKSDVENVRWDAPGLMAEYN
jgi:hypothetical protein